MKTIISENEKLFLLSEKEFNELMNHKATLTLTGEPIVIQIPFFNKHCGNWNESFNVPDYTGLIYKDKEVSLRQLRNILKVLKGDKDQYSEFFNSKEILFDNKTIDVTELETVIKVIEANLPSTSYSERNIQKIITHYSELIKI